MKPSIGRIVHYVHDLGECNAAIVTGIHEHTVSLTVFTFNGEQFNPPEVYEHQLDHLPNSWHWPERVD